MRKSKTYKWRLLGMGAELRYPYLTSLSKLVIRYLLSADGIVISGHSLSIDESSMTGESKIIHKDSTKAPFLMSACKVADGSGSMLLRCRPWLLLSLPPVTPMISLGWRRSHNRLAVGALPQASRRGGRPVGGKRHEAVARRQFRVMEMLN